MRLRIYSIVVLLCVLFNQATAQLSDKTYQEIQLLINEKNSRTPVQQKLDSRLLQFERQQRGQAMAAGISPDAIRMNTDSRGFVRVDIRAEVNDNLLSRIEALGGKIAFSSVLFHTITAEIDPVIAERIAAFPEIRFIEPTPLLMLEGGGERKINGFKSSLKTPVTQSKASFEYRAKRVKELINNYMKGVKGFSPMFSGTVNSQGDKAHRADETRNAYGYAGQGIKIGVLSDSYNSLGAAAADVANGNLPGVGNPSGNTKPVTVLQDFVGGSDEGRAMLQIVHDLAPKAQLFFATAEGGPANFASNIIALRNAPYNCDIIIDDIYYFNEPVFYDGIIAQAVNTVTAGGALYFSSAGNEGSLLKNTSGVYESDFSDAGSPAFPASTKTGTVHNFGTVTTPAIGDSLALVGGYYVLHWADPTAASNNDYDLFLINAAGAVKAFSTNLQSGTQDPYESISPPALAVGDRLVVFKTLSAAPRAFHLNTLRGRLKYVTNGQTHGHSSALDAYSVAATPAAIPFSAVTQAGPFPAAFSPANKVETFESDGPRRIFFNANGTPITPGNFLFATNGGIVRNKPDITAADGVITTLPAGSGLNPFYGTSAAAPHAGAIAALLKSANPSLTSAQVRTLLTTTTVDIEGTGYDNLSGYGILQAFQAMQLLNPTPMASIGLGTIVTSEGSFNNNNGIIDPGELANLSIQLSNASMVDATAVSAILTTSSPGITITQGASGYGTVGAGGNAVNATTFVVAVNSTVPCGTTVNFTLTTSFTGGLSPQVLLFSLTIGSQPFMGITDTLGIAPHAGVGYTVVSGQQTGRIFRTSAPATCSIPLANPGLTITTGARQYNSYTFRNIDSSSQCVTVTMTSPNGTNLYCLAYSDSGFVATNPATHFIAEPGPSSITQTYSFSVGAGKFFTVVVHDVNVTPASNSAYTLNLSLSNCNIGPACTPINITSESIPGGAVGSPYSQSFAALGGSGNYSFSLIGSLPGGLLINGNTLSGTPTQAGTFPIKIIATDLTGCPPDTNSYSLVITGNAPASLAVIKGTPQTVYPMADFPDSLSVVVRDINNNPLSGVNVVFTAPASGASGTFSGGVKTVTVLTNGGGISTAPVFTSNAITGSYIVTATVVGIPDAQFNFTNFCPANFVVTSNADSGPGTLRDIINNGCAGVPITFDPSITSITLTSGELVITKATTITGPGASQLVISGNNNSRIFHIETGAATVSISGITIRDGKPKAGDNGGGGILINNSVPTGTVNISKCVITSNNVSLTAYPYGGGLYNAVGTVNIDRSTIINNTSLSAGGVLNEVGSMVITNSTIAGNTAGSTGGGGGIYSFISLTIINSTIYGNAAQGGGNIIRGADSIRLKNTIVAGGTLLGTGGAGPDLSGTGFRSNDYNFIQNVSGGTITGITTHNITGRNPMLLPLGNFGGETPSLLPQPMSPVINAGDSAIAEIADQRGLQRIASGKADIGAVEANYSLASTAGTPQTTAILAPFAVTLKASVTESSNSISGASVIFTAPATGASGTFTNGLIRDTVVTNFLGVASSHTFRANNIIGMYLDTANIGSAFPTATYSLTNSILLPLKFGAVTASASNCTTNINWSTESEIDNKGFTIEYSEDGVNFIALTTMPSKGNSTSLQSYTYGHMSTQEGVHYYRIRQTDVNGQFTYSNVLIVTNKCGNQPIVVYPNPVINKLTVVIPLTDAHTLTVFDAIGQVIHQQKVHGGTFEINATNWLKGAYTLSITQKGQAAYILKLVKE